MIGQQIKKFRLNNGLRISDLARRADVSKSLISQIERGNANPSIETIRAIASALEVPLFALFLEEDGAQSSLVKKDERLTLMLPGSDAVRELLTPNLDREMVLVLSRLAPGGKTSPVPVSHKGEECTFVLRGKLEQHLGDEVHALDTGDAFYFDARIPHFLINPSDTEEAEFLAVMTPGTLPYS